MTTPTDPRFLSTPGEGLPPLADTPDAVAEVSAALAAGHGPVAVDTERASGFRFDDRAWLVQLRRAGSGTHLVDPASVPDAGDLLAPVMNSAPWTLHAAHTDLPALTTLGWSTPVLHDTQIAGRLLGHGQVGLAGMLEDLLGVSVAKDKGQEDWSLRPLPADMLTYAALDVELLNELLDSALSHLRQISERDGRNRLGWYRQECDHVSRTWSRPVTVADWTRLRGIGAVRDPRGLEAARRLTAIRTDVARQRDTPPEKVLRSSLIVEIARSPQQAEDVLRSGTAPRMPRELRARLLAGVRDALATAPSALPTRPRAPRGRPDHRTWSKDHPVAFRLLTGFRDTVDAVSADLQLDPPELLVSRSVRSVAWDASRILADTFPSRIPDLYRGDPVGWTEEMLGDLLADQDARPWQRDLLVPGFAAVVATELPAV